MNSTISECHWEITKNCNLVCIHCISSTGTKRELNTKNALEAIDNLADWGCRELYITGGEPLTRKDIFAILKKAKEKKFKIGLLTNGILINKRNIEEIKLYVDGIGISLDGSSPQVNDQIRGTGTFGKILEAISIVQKAQIPLALYVTLTKLNLDDFENILRLAKSLGIKNLRVNEVTARGRAWRHRKRLVLDPHDRANLKEYLIKKLKKVFDLDIKSFITNSCCNLKSTIVFLSPTGYIYPCIEIFQKKPSLYLGNIFDFRPKEYREHRNVLSKFKKSKCPYQLTRAPGFTLCLDDPSTKCPVLINSDEK